MRHAKIYVPKLKRPAVERKKSYVLTFGTYVRQNAPTLALGKRYIAHVRQLVDSIYIPG